MMKAASWKHFGTAVFLAIALVISHAAPALAQWNFTLVADQNISSTAPSISGQEIAFLANNNSRLFKRGPTGVAVTLVKAGDPVPNGGGLNFFQLSEPFSFSGQTFAFRGQTTMPTQFGAYAKRNTGTVALAGLGSSPPLPESAGGFLAMDGNDVAFGGTTAIRVLRSSAVQLIDNNTDQPGTATKFSFFTGLDFDNGTVVFSGGSAARQGIYYENGNGIPVKLVDNTDTAPGGSGTAKFSFFLTNAGRLVIDGGDVFFYAQLDDGRIGLFLSRNFGPPQVVVACLTAGADCNPLLPGGAERADRIFNISVSNGEVAFIARDDGNDTAALFATKGGILERVIGTGDILGGRTIDVVGGGNEMRSGDTLAFFVLFFGDPQGSIYRAERLADSGIVRNGSFADGLNHWTPSGSVSVVSGPAVQLTADGPIPGPAQLSQSINTPNGTFMVIFDYKFTTTAGSLELLLNNNSITNIAAPPTLTGGFTRVELLVNNPIVMGLTGANFTFKLHPGSLSEAQLRNILIPNFLLPPRGVYVFAKTIVSGQELVAEFTHTAAAIVQSESPPAPNGIVRAVAAADIPVFGSSDVSSLSRDQTASINAGKTAEAIARATNHFQVIYTGQGSPPAGPVAVNLGLNITGSLDVRGGATAKVEPLAWLYNQNADGVLLFNGSVRLTPFLSFDGSFSSTDIVNDDTSSAFFPTGRKVLVVARALYDNIFHAPVGATVALELELKTTTTDVAIADFFHTMGGQLSSNVPGIQFVPLPGGAPTPMAVDCSAVSLQEALAIASPGSTLSVSGTCNENILIRNEKQRITIDGSGAGPGTRATISGNGNAPVVNIRGKGILLQNFNITGGTHGVHVNRGSNAVLNNNIIQNNDGNGVVIDELAFAVLTNNTIQNHPDAGVFVSENATARIGFNSDAEAVASANTITNNGLGVVVSNNSSGRIIGNTIQNNSGAGVQVLRDSHADVASNTINNNGDGIEVGENSFVQLGEDSGANIYESANSGTNVGFGVKCLVGGLADGKIGSLSGGSGAKSFSDASCTDSLSP
jgi:hypothetical protein